MLDKSMNNTTLAIVVLTDHVDKLINESGNHEGFNSTEWVKRWIETPMPALNNQKPKMFMNNKEELNILLNILDTTVSGAYR